MLKAPWPRKLVSLALPRPPPPLFNDARNAAFTARPPTKPIDLTRQLAQPPIAEPPENFCEETVMNAWPVGGSCAQAEGPRATMSMPVHNRTMYEDLELPAGNRVSLFSGAPMHEHIIEHVQTQWGGAPAIAITS